MSRVEPRLQPASLSVIHGFFPGMRMNPRGGIPGPLEPSMFIHMSTNAQGFKFVERIVVLLASLDLVVDLQILKRPATPASSIRPFKH